MCLSLIPLLHIVFAPQMYSERNEALSGVPVSRVIRNVPHCLRKPTSFYNR